MRSEPMGRRRDFFHQQQNQNQVSCRCPVSLGEFRFLFVVILLPAMRTQGLQPLLPTPGAALPGNGARGVLVRISERAWRQAARDHSERMRDLLRPGLTPKGHHLNSGSSRRRSGRNGRRTTFPKDGEADDDWVTALDPRHPTYNFLIEYYGLKGAKGVRRLVRWAPSPGLLLVPEAGNLSPQEDGATTIGSVEELLAASGLYTNPTAGRQLGRLPSEKGGILLEGATEDDFASTLHLRGAQLLEDRSRGGVVYSPSNFFHSQTVGNDSTTTAAARLASPFLWYRSILKNTLQADPILHCYGLHEWAMLYRPAGMPEPPSSVYQDHLPLRVSQDVVNGAVERRGVSCSHIDALRFFAGPALPLNRYGGGPGRPLQRADQARLEQPACVHAHMDLLKMALKLQPFCDPELLQRVLRVALEARRLDVAASPYDATEYGVGVVPVETAEGRAEYKRRQTRLMEAAEPVRRDLLGAYDRLLDLAFDNSSLTEGNRRLPTSASSSSSASI